VHVREHPYLTRPHRTLAGLAIPVMASLVVEPLAGVVDTAFVERLGSPSASALGAATAIFASVIWMFNFLGVGTQTEVAQAWGRADRTRACEAATLAVLMAALLGVILAAALWLVLGPAARWMSADPTVQASTVTYLKIRLIGAPAMLVIYATFGALRGLQLMRLPLWMAGAASAINIVLDPLLIFGLGPVPRFGIAGAAWATTFSQTAAALWALLVVKQRLGFTTAVRWRHANALVVVGRDMVIRTAALLFFLLVATRSALAVGVDAGAAHQAMRQIFLLMAFVLDAFAFSAQSLIGFFVGAGQVGHARNVARTAAAWGLGTGAVLAVGLLAAENLVAALLVPPAAHALFSSAWLACALAQPLNALSFVTDGIHWGTGDFRFLRNAMLVATGVGLVGLWFVDVGSPGALTMVWWVTALWILVRAAFGVLRIWPGSATGPLA
jgi:MATE family multidrug resistance protein